MPLMSPEEFTNYHHTMDSWKTWKEENERRIQTNVLPTGKRNNQSDNPIAPQLWAEGPTPEVSAIKSVEIIIITYSSNNIQ